MRSQTHSTLQYHLHPLRYWQVLYIMDEMKEKLLIKLIIYHLLQTLSIHHSSPGFFPPSTRAHLPNVLSPEFDPLTLSIPLQRGASNSTYARMWVIVEHIKETFLPDYIVVQCGVDALAGDPCSTFNWSLGNSEGSLSWCIRRILMSWSGKKLLLGGGKSFPVVTCSHIDNLTFRWLQLTKRC